MFSAVVREFFADGGPGGRSNPGGGKNEPRGSTVEDVEKLAEVRLSDVNFTRAQFHLDVLNKLSLGTKGGAHNGEGSKTKVRDEEGSKEKIQGRGVD